MKIEINNIEYKANKPKAKAWRELIQFDEDKASLDFKEYVDSHVDIIVRSFNNKDLTEDILIDNLEVDEIMEVYRKLMSWFCEILTKKLDQLPNDQATAE